MRTEEEIKRQIGTLNDEWNKAFYLSQYTPVDETKKKYLEIQMHCKMAEILQLKWVLGYNHLAPQHTYRKENYDKPLDNPTD